ncbi:MAG: hypothetical protein HOP28_08180 [Gemmatimonadales bacterium]|nr:hypothetical protein [Gemmatimonadales bacterium]
MTGSTAWFRAECAGAPPVLAARAASFLAGEPEGTDAEVALERAAARALGATLAVPNDRAAAIDLLAADALITLALKARAASDPARLGEFAASLRQAGGRIR